MQYVLRMPIICLSFTFYGIEITTKLLRMLLGGVNIHFRLRFCYKQLSFAYRLPITIKMWLRQVKFNISQQNDRQTIGNRRQSFVRIYYDLLHLPIVCLSFAYRFSAATFAYRLPIVCLSVLRCAVTFAYRLPIVCLSLLRYFLPVQI